MGLIVTRAVIERLFAEAAAAHPRECCGLLLGAGESIITAVPAANVADGPARRFEIDPARLIAAHKAERAGGAALAGYYHSHPRGEPVPSAADAAGACGDGRCWAIVGGARVAFWRDAPGGFEALSYRVTDG